MTEETMVSEQSVLDERIAGYGNNILDGLETARNIIIPLLILILIVFLILLFKKRIVLKSIWPPEIIWQGKNSSRKKWEGRQLTDFSAPALLPKSTLELPSGLTQMAQQMKNAVRKRVLIQCSDRSYAQELGKLLYHELERLRAGDYIGWISYRDLVREDGVDAIDACVDHDFARTDDTSSDYQVRRSRRLDLFRDQSKHTILFVNILEFPQKTDYSLELYNNLPGLSLILLSDQEINGYETLLFTRNGGDSNEA